MNYEVVEQRDAKIIQIPTKWGRICAQKYEIAFFALTILTTVGIAFWPQNPNVSNFTNLKMKVIYPIVTGFGGMVLLSSFLLSSGNNLYGNWFFPFCIAILAVDLAAAILINKTFSSSLPDKILARTFSGIIAIPVLAIFMSQMCLLTHRINGRSAIYSNMFSPFFKKSACL